MGGQPEDREQLRRELLTGHLLMLAAGGSAATLPVHALPAVASMLQQQGLIPKWLAVTLTQQPALFEKAFQRMFLEVRAPCRLLGGGCGAYSRQPEIVWLSRPQAMCAPPMCVVHTLCRVPALSECVQELQDAEDDADPSVSWAVHRFWALRPLPMLTSRSSTHLRSRSAGVLDGE